MRTIEDGLSLTKDALLARGYSEQEVNQKIADLLYILGGYLSRSDRTFVLTAHIGPEAISEISSNLDEVMIAYLGSRNGLPWHTTTT